MGLRALVFKAVIRQPALLSSNEQTGLPVHVADDPLSAVAEGTGVVLSELHFLSKMTGSENER